MRQADKKSNKESLRYAVAALLIAHFVAPTDSQAFPYELSYASRITDAQGVPLTGPVDIQVDFFTDPTNSSSRINIPTVAISRVPLADGVFQLSITLTDVEFNTVFANSADTVYIQVTDVTHGKTFQRQQFGAAPYALKIPIDNDALRYNNQGQLTVGTNAPAKGQVLMADSAGKLKWTDLSGPSLTTTTPSSGQILGYDGAHWVPQTAPSGGAGGGGSSITGLTGDVAASGVGSVTVTLSPTGVNAGTYTKVTVDAKGRVNAGMNLTAADIPPLSAGMITSGTLSAANGGTGANLSSTGGIGQYLKQTTAGGSVTVGTIAASDITSSLGFTPLNKAGDTISGVLNFGSYDLTSAGNIQMAASKTFALSGNTADPTGLLSGDKGKTWFNSTTNQIKYWDGSTAVALGVAGSGLSSFNGQTGNTQTLEVPGTSGTGPAWSSAANVHTLNIPLASTTSVTAGLISYSDYVTFNGKVAGVTSGTGVTVSTTGNIATVNLATSGTAGNYAKVTTDAFGRVSSGTSLAAADIPPLSAAIITSGTLVTANGGTGVYSTATFPTSGVVVTRDATETLTNKTLSAATINGASSIGGSTTINTTGIVNSAAHTVAGNVTILGNTTTANKLVLHDKGLANSVALKAPDTLGSSLTLELPGSNGSSGQVLATNGSGTLSWVSGATGSVTNVTGTAPISVATGTSTPVISMSQANGTTNGYLSSADWTTFNSKQAAGNYITALTGDVTAAGPGSAAATLATVAVAGTSTKVTYDVKGRVTSGTSLTASDIPPLSAAIITSGTLAVANGGTGLGTTPSNGQLLIGNGANYALGNLTAGTGINISNSAGAVTVSATADASTKVSKTGDAMSGTLSLPTNGLVAGTNQLVLASGNVGIGTTAPGSTLQVNGGAAVGYIDATTAPSNGLVVSGNVGIGTKTPLGTLHVDSFQTANALTYGVFGGSHGIMFNGYQAINEGYKRYADIVALGAEKGSDLRIFTGSDVTQNYIHGERMRITSSGNVGIGTTAPRSKLDVNGTLLVPAAVNNTVTTINFSTGNLQYTALNCQTFTLSNMSDGGSYTLAIKGTSSAICSFTATGLTVHLPPDHQATISGKHTIYSFMVIGADVYISWIPGI